MTIKKSLVKIHNLEKELSQERIKLHFKKTHKLAKSSKFITILRNEKNISFEPLWKYNLYWTVLIWPHDTPKTAYLVTSRTQDAWHESDSYGLLCYINNKQYVIKHVGENLIPSLLYKDMGGVFLNIIAKKMGIDEVIIADCGMPIKNLLVKNCRVPRQQSKYVTLASERC